MLNTRRQRRLLALRNAKRSIDQEKEEEATEWVKQSNYCGGGGLVREMDQPRSDIR
jgi:hypothetical protein